MSGPLATHRLAAFVATTDAARARTFYGETLGLRLVSDEGFAIVFDANGTMLRVQKVKELVPHPFTALGWNVDDIAATIDALVDRGVTMLRFEGQFASMKQDERGIWTAPDGAQVAWFKDPDGNTLSLAQFAGPA